MGGICTGDLSALGGAVQATRDLDRGRTTQEAVDAQVERDLQQLVAAEEHAGLDLLSDGMLRSQDLFRPLVEAADGLERGALTRFLDTNTFYRAPQGEGGEGRLRANPSTGATWCRFCRAAGHTALSVRALARHRLHASKVAEGILKPQIDATTAEVVVLSEPFLAREDGAELDALSAAFDVLHGGPPWRSGLPSGTPATCSPVAWRSCPSTGSASTSTPPASTKFPTNFGKYLLAGVLDARNSLLEEPRARLRRSPRSWRKGPERVALVPNGDLQYVSEPIAREKIARLGQAKTTTSGGSSMNDAHTFLTHEIGSLAKPPWLVKTSAGRPLEDADVEDARSWGERLECRGLRGAGRAAPEPRRPRGQDERGNWSSRYALRLQEKAGHRRGLGRRAARTEMYAGAVAFLNGLRVAAAVRSLRQQVLLEGRRHGPISLPSRTTTRSSSSSSRSPRPR